MQIERAHFAVSVVTFLGEGRAPSFRKGPRGRRRDSSEPF